jgi:putative transcriptional regulator
LTIKNLSFILESAIKNVSNKRSDKVKRFRLIEEREKKKKSRKEVAAELDISLIYVRKLENGQAKPGRDLMLRFEKYYGLGMKTLFPDIFLIKNDKKFIKTGTE